MVTNKIVLLLFSSMISCQLGQTMSAFKAKPCSKVIKKLSEKWKLDTLGKGGFRIKKAYQLRECKIDRVHYLDVIRNLGVPSLNSSDTVGLDLLYYTYTETRRDGSLYYECIKFSFQKSDSLLIEIGQFDNSR